MSSLKDTSISDPLITNKVQWGQNEVIKKEKLLITSFDKESLTPEGYD